MNIVDRLRTAGCVYAEDEAALLREAALKLEAPDGGALEQLVQRRLAGEPLEVVLGWAQFRGLRVAVRAGVFVPRRRTEILVTTALPLLRPGSIVVDLCCGSGAVAAAVIAESSAIDLWASDIDPVAVATARLNLPPERVFTGDLFAALPKHLRGSIAVITVNAPYVPTLAIELMPAEARDHEPLFTLDGGPNGLDFHHRIAGESAGWLAPTGTVIIETSQLQSVDTAAIFATAGFMTRIAHSDVVDGTAVVATLR